MLAVALMAAPMEAQQRVFVHGYATQGYGSASDYPIYGIGLDGTGNYRSVALQARFLATNTDHFVIQLSHQRLGSSNFMEFEDDVALDWLFYQKRLAGNTIKAGRFPMPRGLFNEIRDVGVVLPFFRASKAFYSEGVETVEGAQISRSFDFSGFSADATAFGGLFDIKAEVLGQEGLAVISDEMTNAVGGQLVLNTPIIGLRVASSYVGADYKNSDQTLTVRTASIDGSFERFFARAEYEVAKTPAFRYQAHYVQGGVRLVGGLWANAQAEFNTNTIPIPGMGDFDIDAIQDYAYGLSYRVSPKLVLKGEYHRFEGYQVGVPVDPFGPPVKNNYFILGMSAAF